MSKTFRRSIWSVAFYLTACAFALVLLVKELVSGDGSGAMFAAFIASVFAVRAVLDLRAPFISLDDAGMTIREGFPYPSVRVEWQAVSHVYPETAREVSVSLTDHSVVSIPLGDVRRSERAALAQAVRAQVSRA